jgi:GAF domain-containing protein
VFLAEAGRLLSESLDYESILQQVADAAVPTLADWCAVDVVHSRAAGAWPPIVRRVAVACSDLAQLAWAKKLGVDVERDWGSPNGLPQVLRTGAPAFFPDVSDDLIKRAGLSEQEKAIFLRIGLRSAICVPLVARGRTFGAISLAMAESKRRYTTDDLALVMELGRHAAIAIDNARLYADERAARLLAERGDDTERLERAFLLLYSRPPLDEEREQARHYLAQIAGSLSAAGVPAEHVPARAWESLARALFLSSEFIYVN